jgi:hypothetical protein
MGESGLNSFSVGYGPVVESCEHCDETIRGSHSDDYEDVCYKLSDVSEERTSSIFGIEK